MRVEVVDGMHHFMSMDASEILGAARGNHEWMTFQRKIHTVCTVQQFEHDVVLGSEQYARESEAILEKIDDVTPLARNWRAIDDVVGAIPNVPAYLAGHPQHMRRRQRVQSDTAPLTLFMDLGSSMGIPPGKILRRGVALLALARVLSTTRAVDLWVGTALSDGESTGTCIWHIDTVPLDLARAAFMIADPSMSRMFGYAMCEQMLNKHLGNHPSNSGKHLDRIKAFAGWTEVLALPVISYHDPMVDDPVGWLRGVLAQYLGESE